MPSVSGVCRDIGIVTADERKRFEGDVLPHLDALWRTARWLSAGGRDPQALVLKTIERAYREWRHPTDSPGNKARLFQILTSEFSGGGTLWPTSGRLILTSGGAALSFDEGAEVYHSASVDRYELLLLTTLSRSAYKRIIVRLGVRARLLALLLFREQFSYAEIAYITHLKPASVRFVLARLRRRIAQYLVHYRDCIGMTETLHSLSLAQTGSRDSQLPGLDKRPHQIAAQLSSTSDATVDSWENEGGSLAYAFRA